MQEDGIKTAIASGRPYFAAAPVITNLGINAAGCFNTGALLFDPSTNKTISSKPLDSDVVNELIEFARKTDTHLELYTGDQYLIECKATYTEYHTRYLGVPPVVGAFECTDALSVLKAMLVYEDRDTERAQLVDALREHLPDHGFAIGHGADKPELNFCSVVAPGACKQQAFEQLLDYHNLNAANVMAIGDADSDIPFIQQAGVGVAMGNARPHVQREADLVTGHVDEGGLAQVLAAVRC